MGEQRHESTRIGKCQCSWKRHASFGDDVKRFAIDRDTWEGIKDAMKRMANGSSRAREWDFPCASTRGLIGELRYNEHAEIHEKDGAITDVEVCYRVYFAEPKLCPVELWAMLLGRKCRDDRLPQSDQQTDIDTARARAEYTSQSGNELGDFPL